MGNKETKETLLLIDSIIWIVSGIIWIIFASQILVFMTNVPKIDRVHIHMTRIFGLFLIYTGLTNYLMNKDKELTSVKINKILLTRIILSILILAMQIIVQLTSNDWNHKQIYFGMIPLILSMIIPITGILVGDKSLS
tara:strand:+ start:1444 stop:1857 length:414 start_codon:yes stop_codon:yes gene_type:complete